MGLRRSNGKVPRRGVNGNASALYGLTNNGYIFLPKFKGIIFYDGNGNPFESGEEFFKVDCMFKPRRLYRERNQRQQGSDVETISMRGAFVKPAIITANKGVRIKQPVKGFVSGQSATILMNVTVSPPGQEVLLLEGVTGVQFTCEVSYDI
jgi:hypothetical protein